MLFLRKYHWREIYLNSDGHSLLICQKKGVGKCLVIDSGKCDDWYGNCNLEQKENIGDKF